MGNFLDDIIKPVKQLPPQGMDFPLDGIGDLQYADPNMDFMGPPTLPPMGSYGQVQPSFNEKIAELAIGTSLTIGGKPVETLETLPTIFYPLTDNWRHFQLSNLKNKDQRDIERRIKYIHLLASRPRYKTVCIMKQIELFNKIYLYKSRCDLDDMRERKIWTLQTQQMNQQDIHRPKEGGGGFLSFFTGRNKGGDY
jgi:hypothetical protein